MSDKYIIKNCPCFNTGYPISDFYGECIKVSDERHLCQDCTDCVLKKIVEKCMEDWEDMATDRFQRELLDLLDIQEVE